MRSQGSHKEHLPPSFLPTLDTLYSKVCGPHGGPQGWETPLQDTRSEAFLTGLWFCLFPGPSVPQIWHPAPPGVDE